jgi:hypothetical protein
LLHFFGAVVCVALLMANGKRPLVAKYNNKEEANKYYNDDHKQVNHRFVNRWREDRGYINTGDPICQGVWIAILPNYLNILARLRLW